MDLPWPRFFPGITRKTSACFNSQPDNLWILGFLTGPSLNEFESKQFSNNKSYLFDYFEFLSILVYRDKQPIDTSGALRCDNALS
jgi:hypothetical protein